MEVINLYGADALRAYLINSPVVRAEPMRFSQNGVREVVRSVTLPLWNAYSFFATYASVDGWEPPATPTPMAERADLDRWVNSVVQSLIRDVNTEMEAYRLYNVIPAVLGFIDDLTNWYIRRSRRRFWRTEDDADKSAAFETLYEVLCTFSRLLAPILPFMAEILYQRLEAGKRPGAEDSVHLERFPSADPTQVDADLELSMKRIREVVTMGRNLRESHKIRIRQPLPSIKIAMLDPIPEALRPVMADIVREELNIKEITWVEDVEMLVTLGAKANFKVLGRRLGKRMKEVAGAIAGLPSSDVLRLMAGDTLTLGGESITEADVTVFQEAKAEGAIASAQDVTVVLDTTLSEELLLEGLAREVVSKVQSARKEAELEVDDRIVLSLRTAAGELATAIELHSDLIASEVLAVKLADLDAVHTDVSAAGFDLAIAVEKVRD